MIRTATILVIAFLALPLHAQQAGDAASTDTEGTFQTLVDACDNVDALMLRARIRLQIPRSTEAAAKQAEEMLTKGFTTCSQGDLEGAKSQLTEALAIAEAGAAERFSIEENARQAAVETAAVQSANTVDASTKESTEDDKPWWKIW